MKQLLLALCSSGKHVIIASGLFMMTWSACSAPPKFEDVYQVITPATLQPGDPIPLPPAEAVLTVTGKIGITNTQDAIVMDLPTIEQTGMVEYTVNDLFEKRPIRFTGVLMRDLLNLWQVDADATTAHFVALNDFEVDIPLAEFRQYPVLFALKADGEYMQRVTRGPAMIVYPVDQYEFNLAVIQWNWIWQIKTIDIQ